MKYLIASDIHGDARCLEKLLARYEAEEAQVLLLLGDLLYHGPRNPIPAGYAPQECAAMLNENKKQIISIAGNCDAQVDQLLLDFPISAPYMIFPWEGGRLVATHGHIPEEELYLLPGDLIISGHTHVLKAEKVEDHYAANPGSVSLPKEGNPCSYAVLEGRTLRIKALEDGAIIKELAF